MKTLEEVLREYQEQAGAGSPGAGEIARFRLFLAIHAGLRRAARPGGEVRILDGPGSLRCYHFSQFLDWYLPEREGTSQSGVAAARAELGRFNGWLLETGVIGTEQFRENGESIRESGDGPPVFQEIGGAGEDPALSGDPSAEGEFHVPGEYAFVLSGEFVLTKIQEGILYGRREGDLQETGPILVDRAASAGSRVGDRVYLSLGKAGDHWNLLGIGRRSG